MGPGRCPQYTRADFGPEAVGSSNHKHVTLPNVKPCGRVKSRIFVQKKKVFVFPFSFKCMSLLAVVSEFNSRCFLRIRCSMEMWCPDDIRRDSWGLDRATYRGKSMIQLTGVGWGLLAKENGASPDWTVVAVSVVVCDDG